MEVRELGEIGIRDAADDVPGARALDLHASALVAHRHELDVESGRGSAEMILAGEQPGDEHDPLGPEVEDGDVVEGHPLLVADRRVVDAPDRHVGAVLGHDVVGGSEGVGPTELPLAQARVLDDAHAVSGREIFLDRVPEVGRPGPAVPLVELDAHLGLELLHGSQISGHSASTSWSSIRPGSNIWKQLL